MIDNGAPAAQAEDAKEDDDDDGIRKCRDRGRRALGVGAVTGLERCAAEARRVRAERARILALVKERKGRDRRIDARADFSAKERDGGGDAHQALVWLTPIALLALATAFWAWALPLPLFCAWLGVAGGWALAQGESND